MHGAPTTILVIERNDEVRDTVRRMLESAGHHVIATGVPADGLSVLSRHRIDIVLTCRMHSVFENGLSLPAMIRAIQPRSAIVLSTGWSAEKVDPVPFDAVLPKPFTTAQLEATIAAVLRRS